MIPAEPLWYKDAIIYELHVKAFADSNADGVGDFPGLIGKLDYLQELGITCIWLLPFYPSPLRDDGYDIDDYHDVHRELRHAEAVPPVRPRGAPARNIRVMTELVINHTSDQHPWFQAARLAPPGSTKRDFYVWSDTDTQVRRRPDHLHRHRDLELDVGPGRQGVLLAPLLPPSARPEFRQPRRCSQPSWR